MRSNHLKLSLWIVLTIGISAVITILFRSESSEIQPGKVYLRSGLPDSVMVASILDVAPNAAGELLISILAFDRPVKIDLVDPCTDIARAYDQIPELIPIPLFLEDQDKRCYSYRLRFDIQDGSELLNLELAMIHPAAHFNLLQ